MRLLKTDALIIKVHLLTRVYGGIGTILHCMHVHAVLFTGLVTLMYGFTMYNAP